MRCIIIGALLAVALAAFGLSATAPVVSTKAYASKMDGKHYGANSPKNDPACFNHGCSKKKAH